MLSVIIDAQFKAFFNSCYGLNIHEHQNEKFSQAIINCCRLFGFTDALQLLQKIQSDSHCDELLFLIKEITVDESYFFRDTLQIDFIKNEFLPDLIDQKRQQDNKQIRIWSAGCSTGQEIYSIAVILHQLLPDFDSWNLHLVGTDINHDALSHAMNGKYNTWSIRTDNDFIYYSGYFKQVDEYFFIIQDFIKNKVKFFFLNLAEDVFPSMMNGTFSLDLILCRNVFIYLDADVIQKTCAKFAESLLPGGILILSVTDPIPSNLPQLTPEVSNNLFYFKRRVELTNFPKIPRKPSIISSELFKKITPFDKAQDRLRDLITLKKDIIQQLSVGNWTEVLNLLQPVLTESIPDADLYQFQAKALINIGQCQEAKIACELSLQLNDIEPHSYLLYGLILMQLSLYNEAEAAFRKTIFLNNDFMEAHYQLGQILLYKGQIQQGIKFITNALNIAEQGQTNRPIHNVISLTYSGFCDLMRNELNILNRYNQ